MKHVVKSLLAGLLGLVVVSQIGCGHDMETPALVEVDSLEQQSQLMELSFDDCPKGGYLTTYAVTYSGKGEFRAIGLLSWGDSHRFAIPMPKGSTNVYMTIDGTGDVDLYAGIGTSPSLTAYDCRPFLNGSKESCRFDKVNNYVYVMINGWDWESAYNLRITWTQPSWWWGW